MKRFEACDNMVIILMKRMKKGLRAQGPSDRPHKSTGAEVPRQNGAELKRGNGFRLRQCPFAAIFRGVVTAMKHSLVQIHLTDYKSVISPVVHTHALVYFDSS